MKKLLRLLFLSWMGLIMGLGLFFSPVWAQKKASEDPPAGQKILGLSNPRVKDLAQQTMMGIYQEILLRSAQYDSLGEFGKGVLSENQHGIGMIQYQHRFDEGVRQGEFLEFGLTVVNSQEDYFGAYGGDVFNFDFPLLGVKFVGYERTNRLANQFSLQDVVQKKGDLLLQEQNKYLPLKLSLKALKDVYYVGEDIEFVVVLKNVSKNNLTIRDLGKETLYFLYAGDEWGAVERGAEKTAKLKEIRLKPGEAIRKRFTGSGSYTPKEFEIYGSYALTFRGVNPFDILKVKVVNK